ncbi:hypothetical protein [Streptomyces sp. NPDC058751]|uniref:hypothetical protein n=1 Tax=Streptomyces sp. NPDC058751 TaxID=3346623 RepID=UPI0036B75DC3
MTDTEAMEETAARVRSRLGPPSVALRSALPCPASRTHAAPRVAERLVRGVEHRSGAVYAQQWVRAVRLARAWLPPLVALRAHPSARRLEKGGGAGESGPLGAGGEAAVGRPS